MSRQRIQQLPLDSHKGHDAIFNASYLDDIPSALQEWNSTRVLLVVSKSLHTNTSVIKDLESRLDSLNNGQIKHIQKKIGVGSHSPYTDIIDIAHCVQTHNIDAVVSVGSGSYSDACKIAVMLSATLEPGFSETDMEALVDQKQGLADDSKLRAPTTKLICVPTSLSAGEWNSYASGTNSRGKKQHFRHAGGSPTLILCDPRVAATTPAHLWLASGVRAIDHCVEGLCSVKCHDEAAGHFEKGLTCLLKGLVQYHAGLEESDGSSKDDKREELLKGIAECQLGSRETLLPWIKWHVSFGASHAIGHQLGSVAGVQHGVTSCILLPPVLAYTQSHPDSPPTRINSHSQILGIFNNALNWQEKSASGAVAKLVALLGLPNRLSQVGVTSDEQIRKVAEMALTDVLAKDKGLPEFEGIVEILDSVR